MQHDPEVLDHLAQLADSTRARLLSLLERQELTVGELCKVTQMPQSTVSRQLKVLVDSGWLVRRPEGPRAYYSMDLSVLGSTERRMWLLVRDQASAGPGGEEDRERLRAVLQERDKRSSEFFSSEAGKWNELRRELFGQRFDSQSLLGLLDPNWTVGDLGCGAGDVCVQLAPFVSQVIGVDRSAEMLEVARRAGAGYSNLRFEEGALETLPLEDDALDVVTLMLVLHHTANPGLVVQEAARVLRPGGLLLIADMVPHEREEYRAQMGHVWLGFAEDTMLRHFDQAGFVAPRYLPQPSDTQAKGPRLFVATARRPSAAGTEPVRFARAEVPEPVSQPLKSS